MNIRAFPHLDAGTDAITTALGRRLTPDILDWPDLFTTDATLEPVFDDASVVYRGRDALTQLAFQLANVIDFHRVEVHEVIDAADGRTITYTSRAEFTRKDLEARFARRYVSIAELQDGRIHHLREYGSTLQPL